MKYEVAYLSVRGNTEKLAHAIADILPPNDTFVTDLSCEELTEIADVYLIGFGMKNNAIPLKIMEVSEKLEGKTVLFFVTASLTPSREHTMEIEQRIEPFLPDDCNYKGLYLCVGQVSKETLQKVNSLLENDPENQQALAALEHCKQTFGRPNQSDMENAQLFFKNKLELV